MNSSSAKNKYRLRICACMLAALVMLTASVPFGSFFGDKAFAEEQQTDEAVISVDPTGQGDGYSAVLYDNNNGLPTSEANDIVMTQEGFIWIGSYSGLIRYDGNTFERIDSTTGVASVVSLYADSKNRLWVGTNDSGVAVMENGEFTMFNKDNGLKALSVRSITEDDDGNIYIATTQGLAVIDENLKMTSIDEPQISNEYIRMLRKGPENSVYGVTKEGSVFVIKNKQLTGFYDNLLLGINDLRSVLPDMKKPGYVYLAGSDTNLYYGDLSNGFKSPKVIDIYNNKNTNSILEFGDMIWLCSDTGISLIENGKYSFLYNVPMNTSVENMITDYQGNMWFASSQQGVMKIVPNQFTNIFEKYSFEPEVVYTTCRYEDKLLIGTKNNGIFALQKDEDYSNVLPVTSSHDASGREFKDEVGSDLLNILNESKIRSIIRDSKDRLWFSTFSDHCLLMYDHGEVTKFTTNDGMPSDRVRAVYERSDGSILAACTGGIVVIENNKITQIYGESSGIGNTEVLTVTETANGEILAGTDGGGIYAISKNGMVHYGTESGLRSDVIMRIKKDTTRDVYWIITSNSIAYMTSDFKFETINKFPYSNNFDVYENSKGKMWILSSNGIYVIDSAEMLENGDINPIYYGKDNGLPCIATSNSYSELTENGDLYIAGTTGVAKVNIEKNFESVSDIKMSVPYIEADGEKIFPNEDGEFEISSKVKKITIYSFVYNYSLTNPQVTYRLDGFDKNSTTVKRSDLVPIDYTNLSGGTYNFVLEIQDPHGQQSKVLNVKIVKFKAMYEMLWFRIACTVLIAGVILLLVKLYIDRRTRNFIKKENEQKALIREIVEAFAKVVDMKDKYTNGHSSRVAEYTSMLTKELGYDEETIEKYYNIALMHDIGKIGVPPEVLNKPGKLTDREFAIIKSHSALGYNALKDISIMPELAVGAGAHHERPDGKGYPKGLKGEEIPRVAQIIAVADTFDAMYSDRPYRKRMNFEKVVSIMKEVRGTQLTEDVVDAFLRLVEKGEFRDPNDDGGGSTEDIDNIHKRFNKQKDNAPDAEKPKEESTPEEKTAEERKTAEKPEEKPAE